MIKYLSKEDAKNILVRYHMINTDDNLSGYAGILYVMNRIQSIQQDPLDVVGRNTDLVMQSRVKDYTRNGLDSLLYQERVLIDGWDKMMAVYQTKDFHKFDELRKIIAEQHIHTLKYRNQHDAIDIIDEVMSELKKGPKFANEFHIGSIQKNSCGQSKLSSAALDYLFFKGDIGVRMKNITQKQYDLIDNLIDRNSLEEPLNSKEAFIEYYLLRRIKALGICRDKSGVHLSGPYIDKKETRAKYLNLLLGKNLIEKIEIEGIKEPCYIPIEMNELTNKVIDRMSFIAPLDNLIWDRDFIENLFGFKYRWEVYTPVIKREYGYYVLPILYGNEFVGRIGFDTYRRDDELKIKNIWIAQDLENSDHLKIAIERFKKYLKILG